MFIVVLTLRPLRCDLYPVEADSVPPNPGVSRRGMPHEFNNYVAPLNAAGEPQDWFDSGLFGDPDAVLKIRQAYFASVSYLVRSRNRTAGVAGLQPFRPPPRDRTNFNFSVDLPVPIQFKPARSLVKLHVEPVKPVN